VNLFQKVSSFLREMAMRATDPNRFRVDYYAITRTPKGSMSRFTITSTLDNIRGNSRSETAVLAYLQRKHPCCDIQINSLEFIQ
jgi:hypothetical protein